MRRALRQVDVAALEERLSQPVAQAVATAEQAAPRQPGQPAPLRGQAVDGKSVRGCSATASRYQAQVRSWAGGVFQAPLAKIQEMEPRGDLALVTVLVTQPGMPWVAEPYQETRFYRRAEGAWQRMASVTGAGESQPCGSAGHGG